MPRVHCLFEIAMRRQTLFSREYGELEVYRRYVVKYGTEIGYRWFQNFDRQLYLLMDHKGRAESIG